MANLKEPRVIKFEIELVVTQKRIDWPAEEIMDMINKCFGEGTRCVRVTELENRL